MLVRELVPRSASEARRATTESHNASCRAAASVATYRGVTPRLWAAVVTAPHQSSSEVTAARAARTESNMSIRSTGISKGSPSKTVP